MLCHNSFLFVEILFVSLLTYQTITDPFAELVTNEEVIEKVIGGYTAALLDSSSSPSTSGYRLCKLPQVFPQSDSIFKLITMCTNPLPQDRPTFTEIQSYLSHVSGGYGIADEMRQSASSQQ